MTSQFTNRDMAQVWGWPNKPVLGVQRGLFRARIGAIPERLLEAANIHATDNVMDIGLRERKHHQVCGPNGRKRVRSWI